MMPPPWLSDGDDTFQRAKETFRNAGLRVED